MDGQTERRNKFLIDISITTQLLIILGLIIREKCPGNIYLRICVCANACLECARALLLSCMCVCVHMRLKLRPLIYISIR